MSSSSVTADVDKGAKSQRWRSGNIGCIRAAPHLYENNTVIKTYMFFLMIMVLAPMTWVSLVIQRGAIEDVLVKLIDAVRQL